MKRRKAMSSYNYGENNSQSQTSPGDKKSLGFGFLSFMFPLVGLILFIVWHREMPKKAKSAGIGAIIGFVLGIVIGVISFVALYKLGLGVM
jgi:drug/metabolite transporter (DMT)-like permease